jgi:prevent-host-death family protein
MEKLSTHRNRGLNQADWVICLPSNMTTQGSFLGMAWQVQDAKARFSEFLDASLREGPQVVIRYGVETAVLVPIEEWRRLKHAARLLSSSYC